MKLILSGNFEMFKSMRQRFLNILALVGFISFAGCAAEDVLPDDPSEMMNLSLSAPFKRVLRQRRRSASQTAR